MQNLIEILKIQGRSQSWLAERIGIHRVTLSNKISGKSKWTKWDRKKIALALGVPERLL